MGDVVPILPSLQDFALLLHRGGFHPRWIDSEEVPGLAFVVAICPVDPNVPHAMQADGEADTPINARLVSCVLMHAGIDIIRAARRHRTRPSG